MDASTGSLPLTAGRVWTMRGTGWRLEDGKAKRPLDFSPHCLPGWNGGLTGVPFLYQRPQFLSGSHFLRLQDFPGSRSVCSSTLPSFGVLEHPLLGSLTFFFFNIYLFI